MTNRKLLLTVSLGILAAIAGAGVVIQKGESIKIRWYVWKLDSEDAATRKKAFKWLKRLAKENVHIGPSDHVPWQKDNKVAFIRMEGKLFGDVPMNLELRLSVEDSPNSAGVAIDSIRCCKLALDRGQGGILHGPSAYFSKHPPKQFTDDEARRMTEEFIAGEKKEDLIAPLAESLA